MNAHTSFLKDVFGFDDFREGQEEIVAAVTAGADVLAIMPTGGLMFVSFSVKVPCFSFMTRGIIIVIYR